MAYIAPIHRPSSVRHAIRLSFLAPNEDVLVVAKSNYLEIWSPNDNVPGTLQLSHTKAIYGKVTLLEKLRPATSETDHLFVGTDRHHYFTLSWDALKKELRTEKSYVDIAEKASRDSQTGDRVQIDPSNRFLALECYEGIVTVLPFSHAGKGKRKLTDDKIGELCDPIPVRIPELFVRSTCFLHKRSEAPLPNPEIAILAEDSQSRMHVKVRELEYSLSLRPREEPSTAELEKVKDVSNKEVELGATFLIPLPEPMYGFLIVGETSISYVEESEYRITHTKALDMATVFAAWCAIDNHRFALADDYGQLYLLYIIVNNDRTYQAHQLDVLGETSRAATLVHLGEGRIFVGSNQGDSQIVQIEQGGLKILQSFSNIGPILDFTVMDMGNRTAESVVNEFSSGQARIVTGSGAYKDGSLRSVRSGVGLEDQGTIGIMGAQITAMHSLRGQSGKTDSLLASFVDRTRVFTFDADGQCEEVESFNGLDLSSGTLYAGQTPDGRTVQITTSGVLITTSDGGMVTDTKTWQPPSGYTISAADFHDTKILLSLQGEILITLDVSGAEIQVLAQRKFEGQSQVSCFTIARPYDNACMVGFWQGGEIAVLELTSLKTVKQLAEDEIAIPRSLEIAKLIPDASPTLFIGLADGNVVTYTISADLSDFSSRKSMVLGTQEPTFTTLPRGNGVSNVFANCEHPSLIYGTEGRIVYSAVTADNVTAVCSFDAEAFPNAIAIASTEEGELRLAIADEERTTHVEPLPIHETVRRVAYSPALKAFGIGTIKRTLNAGVEIVASHFKLVDEVVFTELDTFALDEDELIECAIRCELLDSDGIPIERFAVGTAFFEDEGREGVRGRLLIFEVTAERKLKVVVERSLKGACRCLAAGHNRIVAALVKTLVVFSYDYDEPNVPSLNKQAVYRTATAPIDITMDGLVVGVTDLMKSLSLVKLDLGQAGGQDTLTELGRHFETVWGTAVAKVADNTFLQADAEGNLMVLQHEVNGYSEEDRRRLRVTSEMKLGEMVNRIRRIDVQPTPGAVVIPRAFMATVDGSIYLFALIAPGKVDLLMRMQSEMAKMVQAPGHVPFAKARGFKTEVRDMGDEGPVRFVDGTLIELYLDCSEETQQAIAAVLKVSADELQSMVEMLKRTH